MKESQLKQKRAVRFKTIFHGDVIAVLPIGAYQTVIIRHGKYVTSYSNLASVSVSRGQKVNDGQAIGTAGADDEGIGEIELRVDTEKSAVNPTAWIRR